MKKVRRIIASMLVAVMVMCCAVPAMAAEVDETAVAAGSASVNEAAETTGIGVNPLVIDDWCIGETYAKVISTEVRNKTVRVDVHNECGSSLNYNPSDYQVDIMVFSADGLIWKESDWMKDRNYASFWIGTDVTGVWLRIIPRSRLFPAPARLFAVQIAY